MSDRRVNPDHLSLDSQRDERRVKERREQVRRATDHIGRGTGKGPFARIPDKSEEVEPREVTEAREFWMHKP